MRPVTLVIRDVRSATTAKKTATITQNDVSVKSSPILLRQFDMILERKNHGWGLIYTLGGYVKEIYFVTGPYSRADLENDTA